MMMQLNKFILNLIKYSCYLLITININYAFAQIVSSNKTEVYPNVKKLNIEVKDSSEGSSWEIKEN